MGRLLFYKVLLLAVYKHLVITPVLKQVGEPDSSRRRVKLRWRNTYIENPRDPILQSW